MPRGIGRAMETAIARKEPEEPRAAPELLFMHPRRRELFRLLCLRPCATAGELARQAHLSANAVRWHLEQLVVAGFVVRDAEGAYHPRDFIDPADGPLFRILVEGAARAVLRQVLEAPGSSQREIAQALDVSRQSVFKSAAVLEAHGLVTSIEDGRFRRYYPTKLLSQRQEAHRPRARAFATAFLKRLEAGGLTPVVLRRMEGQMLLRIGRGRNAESLELPLDPYATVLR